MADTVKMTVVDGYAVYVDGEQRSGGSSVEVPADLAGLWERAGWVVRYSGRPAARRKPAESRVAGAS